jgi:hypothetical protein
MSEVPSSPETIEDEFGSTSDDEFDVDEEAWDKFAAQGLSPEFLSQFPNYQAQIESWDNVVDDELDADLTFDGLETNYEPLPDETVPATDEAYTEIKETTDAQKDAVGEQDRAARSKMRRRAVLILLSVAIVEALLVYFVKIRNATVPAPSGNFKQADADTAKGVLDNFRARPDPAFWAAIANYVEQAGASLQSQMVMMGYIKNWSAADPVTWGPTEKSDDILALARAVTPGHLGGMYRQVASMQHNGTALQRAVAADLCENALAQLIATAQASSQS